MIRCNTKSNAPTIIPPNRILVSVNTGDINKLVRALFVAGLIRNDPPKYLNRSKFAVIIYLIQLAPDATKVTIIVIKYRSIETVVDTMPFLNIVDIELNTKLDEFGLHYSRFVTHLKFLAYRVFAGQMMNQQEKELVEMVQRLYTREYAISEKIAAFIAEKYNHEISPEEKAYLTLHIRRIQPNIQ